MTIPIFQPFAPIPAGIAFDGSWGEGGLWCPGPLWWCWLRWVPYLIDRNMRGTIAYDESPEPWPGFFWAVQRAENSHFSSPWEIWQTRRFIDKCLGLPEYAAQYEGPTWPNDAPTLSQVAG